MNARTIVIEIAPLQIAAAVGHVVAVGSVHDRIDHRHIEQCTVAPFGCAVRIIKKSAVAYAATAHHGAAHSIITREIVHKRAVGHIRAAVNCPPPSTAV